MTPIQAAKHPKWKMGKKISIDSATLMNKVLEVIEASLIFKLPINKFKIIIHPESLVHAIVQFKNSLSSMLYYENDMKIPIINSLYNNFSNISIKNDFINTMASENSRTENVYSKLITNCNKIMQKKILRQCISKVLPGTTGKNTWNAYANIIEGRANSLKGKTGSDGTINTLNFAGCYRHSPKNLLEKSTQLNSVTFGFFMDFDHSGTITPLGQDGLDDYRPAVYKLILKKYNQ